MRLWTYAHCILRKIYETGPPPRTSHYQWDTSPTKALAHILTRTSWEDMYDFSCARRDPHKFLHLFPKFTCPIYMKVLYMEFKKVSKMLQESTNYLGDANKRWNRPPDSNGRSHRGHWMAIGRPASSHAGRPEPATLVVIRERMSWAGAWLTFIISSIKAGPAL